MDEESESESESKEESDSGATNTNSNVRLPLKVARVEDDSESCEEVSQPKSSSNKAKAKSTKRKNKTRASSRFLERWKQIPEFKTWLQSRHNPNRNISTAYCTACSTYLTNSKKDLKKTFKYSKAHCCNGNGC